MSTFVSELSGSLIFRSGSSEQTSLVPTANALALTGSLNITGSSLTFNGSDIISRIVNLEAGTGGGASIGPLNIHSASINNFTSSYYTDSASFDSRIDAVESTTSTNSSAITQLQSNTSSYISSTSQLTDSGFLTSSNSSIVSSSGQIAAFGYITSASVAVPAGTVSSSAQISVLGYITGSPENTISSSQQIIDLGFSTDDVGVFIETGSFFATTNDLQVSGSFRVSGSVAANSFISTDGTGQPTLSSNSNLILSASDAVIIRNALLRPGRFTDSETGSLAAIDGDILFNTSSYKLQFYSGSAFYDIGASNIPAGTISSSQQIEDLGFVTSSGGSSTDITALNTFTASYYVDSASFSSRIDTVTVDTSSLDTRITSLETFSSSLDTNFATDTELSALSASAHIARLNITASAVDTGSLATDAELTSLSQSAHIARLNITASGGDTTGLLTTASYQIDSASFDSRIAAINASGDTSFNGDRIVSNEDLGDLYTNSFNAGTTGSIQDFLTAVFFPNTAPSFNTSANQEVVEFAVSGSTLVTLSATDSEGQSVTFALASSYTDGYVTVSSAGVVKLAVVPTEVDFNTVDRGDGTLAHAVDIEVTDSFGSTTTQTFYFTVNANTAPKFRQTSTSGTVITSFTANRNENASTGLVGRIYFTDDEGDAITITSASDANGHFTLTKYATYVQIDQVTGSLDYENIISYTMSITASDEHYPSQDAASITTLPITVNVTDNLQPTINNQTLGSINEDSSDGTTVGTIASSDTEGDPRTFFDFTLSKLELDNADVPTGTYGGTSQASDPTENPFQMNSSGVVTRKAGIYLNSDLINEYQYSVKVKDSFNTASNSATVTIPIADDPAPFIYDNWSGGPYVIESATTGNQIKTNSNGFSGTQARVTSNEGVTWSTNSSLIQVSSTGYLSMNTDVSGSYTAGQTFQADITASNSFGTTNDTLVTFTVTENQAPVLTLTDLGLNSDTAISGANIASVSITDQETDTPYTVSLSGTDAGIFNLVSNNAATSSLNIQPTGSLETGTYNVTVTATDSFDKAGSGSLSIEVTQAADIGKVYVYDIGFFDGTYNNNLGIQSVGSETIPVATSYTGFGFVEKIEDGNLGVSSFTYSWGTSRTATLLESGSDGATVGEILQNMSTISRSNSNRFIILAPSGSDLVIPTTMTDGYGGSTAGEYVLEAATDGTALGSGLGTSEASSIHKVNLGSAHLGFSSWVMIGANNQIAGSTSLLLDVRPSSGSAPS